MHRLRGYPLFLLVAMATHTFAIEDAIELETTRIIANEELPGILYLVPWKDVESARSDRQKMLLHDFFGDLYDPISPDLHRRSQAVPEGEN